VLARELGPRYTVVGEIGRGGFAIVFRVDASAGAHRRLAVKVMRRELMPSPVLVGRFKREIRLVSRLSHPNVLPVLFASDQGSLVYYAMPRVRGETLKERLRRGRLSVRGALDVLRGMAQGLDHAHSRGVVHRDLKPSNVMLDEHSQVMLLDFGLARALAPHGGTLTVSGEVIGSPQYMSPEQAMGERNVGEASDVYSWALVGYEMLVGQPAFAAGSIQEVMRRHLTETPPRVDVFNPEVPSRLADLLERCLESRRARRPRSFGEVLSILSSLP
jgi:serine/threonine-protein kinase